MTLTPVARWLRSLLQVLVAVGVTIPTAIAAVPIPGRYHGSVALVVGIAGAIVLVVTAIQNALEAKAGSTLLSTAVPHVQPAPPAAAPPLTPEPPGPPAGMPPG